MSACRGSNNIFDGWIVELSDRVAKGTSRIDHSFCFHMKFAASQFVTNNCATYFLTFKIKFAEHGCTTLFQKFYNLHVVTYRCTVRDCSENYRNIHPRVVMGPIIINHRSYKPARLEHWKRFNCLSL